MAMKRTMVGVILSLVAACTFAEQTQQRAFPGAAWDEATPESQGIDSAKLQAAVDYLRDHVGRNGVERLVVIRNGRLIWKGPEFDRPQRVWSVTKAFTSTANGLLIEDGKCTLETLAKDYNPELAEYYPHVTLRHLATMTSGYDGAGGSYDFDEQGRGDENALAPPCHRSSLRGRSTNTGTRPRNNMAMSSPKSRANRSTIS